MAQDTSSNTAQQGTQQRDPAIVREIPEEEFNPTGTVTLSIIYFAILVFLWAFMYFVEFVGHGPSING
ncbi:MAG: hypothetical protein ACQETE_11555 [Bacteroidota bacterium]|jgi:hypothetical protein